MEYEFEGSNNMPDLFFDDTGLTVGDTEYPYSECSDIRISYDVLFAAYGVLEIIHKGKKISVPFPKKYTRQIRKVLEKVKKQKQQPITTADDPYEQVKKLKELLDMGAITQEEFDAKKKELLHL